MWVMRKNGRLRKSTLFNEDSVTSLIFPLLCTLLGVRTIIFGFSRFILIRIARVNVICKIVSRKSFSSHNFAGLIKAEQNYPE